MHRWHEDQNKPDQQRDYRGQPWCRGKTNFFEKRVGEYQKSGVMAGLDSGNRHDLNFDADF